MPGYLDYTWYEEPHLLECLEWIVDKVERERDSLGRHLRILDIGCGTGMIAMPLASLGHYVSAVDISPENVQFATEINSFKNLNFRCADCTSEAFPSWFDTPFDIVIASQVIEHVEDPSMLIRNAVVCASDAAEFLFTTINAFNQVEALVLLLEKLHIDNLFRKLKREVIDSKKSKEKIATSGSINVGRGAPHVQHFTIGKLKKLLAVHGLEVVEIANTGTVLALGFLGPLLVSRALLRFNLALGDRVPHALAGGWYLACRCCKTPV